MRDSVKTTVSDCQNTFFHQSYAIRHQARDPLSFNDTVFIWDNRPVCIVRFTGHNDLTEIESKTCSCGQVGDGNKTWQCVQKQKTAVFSIKVEVHKAPADHSPSWMWELVSAWRPAQRKGSIPLNQSAAEDGYAHPVFCPHIIITYKTDRQS